MSAPFQPVGDRARWQVLYELLCSTNIGQVLTYEAMAGALGISAGRDRALIRTAIGRAAEELELVDHRAIEAVRNEGYRVVEAIEHLRLARGHQKRAKRSLHRGHAKVVYVDLRGLDAEARREFGVVADAFALQLDLNRRLDIRQRRLEEAVNGISQGVGRPEAEIAELRGRLERLEERRSA